MHPQSGPPSQPSMSASSNPSGLSPYAFDAARRRSLNGTLPSVRSGPSASMHPRLRTNLRPTLILTQLPPTILPCLPPSHDLRCRRRRPRHLSSTCPLRTRNAPPSRPPSPPAETSLHSARRIAQGAACPSRPSSVEAMQLPPLRPPNRSPRLPPTPRCPTTTACSHPRPDAPFHLHRGQTLLPFVDSHRPTG